MLRESLPAMWSPRFWTMLRENKIAGIMEWGGVVCRAHNRVELQSLARMLPNATTRAETDIFQPNVDVTRLPWPKSQDFLRWFRYPRLKVVGRLLALEEWINHKSKTEHKRRIAVFDTMTGGEMTGALVDALTTLEELERITEQVEAELQTSTPAPEVEPLAQDGPTS